MTSFETASTSSGPHPANLLNLDYRAAAAEFRRLPWPIIDAHAHIIGTDAVRVFKEAMDLYGIQTVYSMTPWEYLEPVREQLGERIHFIAVPNWRAEDKKQEFTERFLQRIRDFHSIGSRIVKFWAAPRSTDVSIELGEPGMMRLDAPHRVRAMEVTSELGMMFMAHIADPDTWFATKYSDASVYGTKAQQYEPFERLLDRFTQPWIAAHMGGWPEDLDFLDGLLERHDNLHLDTSACKWMVRELSRHPRDRFLEFLTRWKGRILFGSDIVTTDDHLQPAPDDAQEMMRKANSPQEAFDLYASRYWALRTFYESDYDGPSPIADPDLALVDPEHHTEMDSPPLRGKDVPDDLLEWIYSRAAHELLDPLHEA